MGVHISVRELMGLHMNDLALWSLTNPGGLNLILIVIGHIIPSKSYNWC